MSRQIKFRGMDIEGRWFNGLLSISQGKGNHPDKGHYISNSSGSPWAYRIRPETLGQYTGLKDSEDAEIYEGDVLVNPVLDCFYVVQWDVSGTQILFNDPDKDHAEDYYDLDEEGEWAYIMIRGNIYENPELLEG